MNPIANFNSALEIVFALNAMTFIFSIEPERRRELLSLFTKFKDKVPQLDRNDVNFIRGHMILAHYGMAHLSLTFLSLLFAATSIALLLYGGAQPEVQVSTQWMVLGVIAMVTITPFSSIWLTFVCKTQFEKYLSQFEV
ncbi:MAG: hypothetical protein AAF542_05580 [Pseudomonadota bacterium]